MSHYLFHPEYLHEAKLPYYQTNESYVPDHPNRRDNKSNQTPMNGIKPQQYRGGLH